MSEIDQSELENSEIVQYVTILIGGQLFGLPIECVHDVFMPENITRVPLSSLEIAGVLNLRGRIVTTISMRQRLHLPKEDEDQTPMAVGIEYRGESYGLIIDEVGEVLYLSSANRQPNPSNLDSRWAEISAGVHRMESELMVVLDVERLLGSMYDSLAAA